MTPEQPLRKAKEPIQGAEGGARGKVRKAESSQGVHRGQETVQTRVLEVRRCH